MHYTHDSRTVTAFSLLPLLRFGAPQYETDEGEGRVTWPIDRGLLVAREGRGQGRPAGLGAGAATATASTTRSMPTPMRSG